MHRTGVFPHLPGRFITSIGEETVKKYLVFRIFHDLSAMVMVARRLAQHWKFTAREREAV